MNESEFDKFKDRLVTLAEVFEAEVSELRHRTYFEALKRDLTIDQWKRAVGVAIQQWKFVRTLPPPAVLREYALGGTQEDAAALAWEVIVGAWRRAGRYDSVLFEDGVTGHTVLQMFGSWQGFVEEYESLSSEMVASRRKQFLVAWKGMQSRRGPCYLPGFTETTNRQTAPKWNAIAGETFKQPVLVVATTGEMKKVSALFSRAAGTLTTSVQQLLSDTEEVKRLTPGSE